jgi:solute carrier family 25 iron transporter 28/37
MSSQDDLDDLEWEEWRPDDISFRHHMIAGSFAGLVEHLSIFPIDTLKTHMQCERCVHGKAKPVDALTCASNLIREKGILRLWRGVSATFTGCVPGACSCIGFIRPNSSV